MKTSLWWLTSVLFAVRICGGCPQAEDGTWLELDPDFSPSGFIRNLTGSVALDSEAKELFVAQRLSPHLLVLDAMNGTLLRTLHEAEPYISRAHFVRLRRTAKTKKKELWVTDAGGVPDDGKQKGHTVLSFSPVDGSLLRAPIGVPGEAGTMLSPLEFGSVTDIAFSDGTSDGDEGLVFVSDGEEIGDPEQPPINNRVVVLKQAQATEEEDRWDVELAFGSEGNGTGQFFIPHAIQRDRCDRLWVADRNNSRLQVFNTGGGHLATWDCFRPRCPQALAPFGDLVDGSPGRWLLGADKDLLVLPFPQDCSVPEMLGNCSIELEQTINFDEGPGQIHSVVSDAGASAVFTVVIEDPTDRLGILEKYTVNRT